jgi:tryptophan 2,3-dioxygenase
MNGETMDGAKRIPITYGSYLRIPELLSLQRPVSDGPEHDEMLFIVIHQVYELWFRQQIHEGAHLRDALAQGDLATSGATLRRMLVILKTMVAQVDVLETMTPVQFLSFRSFLESASGFQSWQFRAFEFLLGKKNPRVLGLQAEGSPERRALEDAFRAPTVWDAFARALGRHGIAVPESVLGRDVTQPVAADPDMQATLMGVYRSHPALRDLCERLIDLDEGVQEWRYRHVKMVERTIGFKQGTGGSAGAEYLRTTLFTPLYPDLWAIRTAL